MPEIVIYLPMMRELTKKQPQGQGRAFPHTPQGFSLEPLWGRVLIKIAYVKRKYVFMIRPSI